MHDFRWPALITLGVLVLLFVLAGLVGRARDKYGIKAPAMTGHPDFERAFRTHMNTVENTVIFLPALWLFAAFVSEIWAVVLGAVWLAARGWYAAAYLKDTAKRGVPMTISMLAFAVLTLGAACGVMRGFF